MIYILVCQLHDVLTVLEDRLRCAVVRYLVSGAYADVCTDVTYVTQCDKIWPSPCDNGRVAILVSGSKSKSANISDI